MNCKTCKADCARRGENREKEVCPGFIPMTNADHIRNMTDIELMFFLNAVIVNHHVKSADNCRHCPLKAAKPCDTEGLIDWLQMPWNEKE